MQSKMLLESLLWSGSGGVRHELLVESIFWDSRIIFIIGVSFHFFLSDDKAGG